MIGRASCCASFALVSMLSACGLDLGSEDVGGGPPGAGGEDGVGASASSAGGSGGVGDDPAPFNVSCPDCTPLAEVCMFDLPEYSVIEVDRPIRATRSYASAGYVRAMRRAGLVPDPSRVLMDDIVNDFSRVMLPTSTTMRLLNQTDPDKRFLVRLESYAFTAPGTDATGAPEFAVVVDRTVRMAPVFELQEALVATLAERGKSVQVTAVGGDASEPFAYEAEAVSALFAAPQPSGDLLVAVEKAAESLDVSVPSHLVVITDGSSPLGPLEEIALKQGVLLNVIVAGQIDEAGNAAFDVQNLVAARSTTATLGVFVGPNEDPAAIAQSAVGDRFDEVFGIAFRDPHVIWAVPDLFVPVSASDAPENATSGAPIGFDRVVSRTSEFWVDSKFDVEGVLGCLDFKFLTTAFVDQTKRWADCETGRDDIVELDGVPGAPAPMYFSVVDKYARALRNYGKIGEACTAVTTAKDALCKGTTVLDPTLCENLEQIRVDLDFIGVEKTDAGCPL
jgi:hypothetical protein